MLEVMGRNIAVALCQFLFCGQLRRHRARAMKLTLRVFASRVLIVALVMRMFNCAKNTLM